MGSYLIKSASVESGKHGLKIFVYYFLQDMIEFCDILSFIAGPYCISMPMKMCHLVRGLLVLKLNTLMNAICAVGLHQIVSGRHRQVMCVLHHLIGAAAVSASRWKGLNLFMKSVVKGMQLFGVRYSKTGSRCRVFLVYIFFKL